LPPSASRADDAGLRKKNWRRTWFLAWLSNDRAAAPNLPVAFRPSFTDRQVQLMTCPFAIRPQTPADTPAIDALHEEAFGPGRFARTAYRIREASTQPSPIALTAWHDGELAGAILFTAITVAGKRGALLLGPLAIRPAYKSKGAGLKLMQAGLARAKELGFSLVILIGDLPYYSRVGFGAVPPGRIVLPGPADPARFLALELKPAALADYAGLVAADNDSQPLVQPAAPATLPASPRPAERSATFPAGTVEAISCC
jgi:predicted N-acetyltransferase YhbS